MKVLTFVVLFLMLGHTGYNQHSNRSASDSEYEYIPADFSYDLIKDRLSCIENEVPLNYHQRVYAFINYFTVKDREYTKMIIQRKNIYFPIFEKYLKKYNLPDELKYLSIIESGLNPKAISRAKAAGLWQFMPYTGKQFGLHQDWYIDERMDPEKSTEAACRFLKQLYGMFGNWELAIAAYNTGPGNVRKAMRRSGYKRTFWEIYSKLYRETRSYLPQYVAMVYTLNYLDEHNFDESDAQYAIKADTVNTNKFVHLKTLAGLLNICEDDLTNLNPALKRKAVPKTIKGYSFNLPKDVKELLNSNRMAFLDSASKSGKEELKAMAQTRPGSTYGRQRLIHKVRSGDVLGTIAERYHVRVSDIRSWNGIRGNTIRVGQRLNIWAKAGRTVSPVIAKPSLATVKIPKGAKTYVVQPGDTLWDISRKFEGLSIEKIKQLNKMHTSRIKPGQQLIIGI